MSGYPSQPPMAKNCGSVEPTCTLMHASNKEALMDTFHKQTLSCGSSQIQRLHF